MPILLSIGYSACHWCHVMERESFEDGETAGYMNEHFVPVKVDREERPDVDAIYMEAVQQMTGHGGWPMTVFCDPDGIPFYGGTYFPPEPRQGMPSFRMVLEAIEQAWREQREEIRERADGLSERLARAGSTAGRGPPPRPRNARPRPGRARGHRRPPNGGFGGAPKFPPAAAIDFLLGRGERTITEQHPRRDGRWGHLRPARRRLRPLLGRRRLARPALREDALRQRAARPHLPPRLADAWARALQAGMRGNARVGAARDARPRGRLLLRSRRGLRGSRGPLLRVE